MLHRRLLLEWADIEGAPGVRSAAMVGGSLTTWEVVLRPASAVVRIDFPAAYPFDPPSVEWVSPPALDGAGPLGMLHPAVWRPTVTAADVIAEVRRRIITPPPSPVCSDKDMSCGPFVLLPILVGAQ